MPHPIFKSKLRDKTRILLAAHMSIKGHSYADIARATGLSDNWILQFDKGTIHHTDVGRVETLYNHLSIAPLEVE